MKMTQNKNGFSLIELMVVVAIIGILATIAVPNFQKFQARSKQTNAKAELSSVFSAQKSFFAEYSTYSAHLVSVGYVPEGMNETGGDGYSARLGVKRYYGVSAGLTSANDNNNITGSLLLSTPTANYNAGYPSAANLCSGLQLADFTTAQAAATASISINADMFTALSSGCPLDSRQATLDVWHINNQRILTNAVSGL